MSIERYVQDLSPQEFEELCVRCIQWMYRDKPVVVLGTQYNHDGGKDAIVQSLDLPYQVWAEVKKHAKSIGLEHISKNVVLAISEGINALLFFSVSVITPNTRKHISIVASKHNFSVSFFDQQRLFDILMQVPSIAEALHDQPHNIQPQLLATKYLSPFENSDQQITTNKLILQRDNHFYIELHLANWFPHKITDVQCTIPDVEGLCFSIETLDKCFDMLAASDRVIRIHGEVLSNYAVRHIPYITIAYILQGEKQALKIKGGWIDPTKLIYYPLVGEGIHAFINSCMIPLFTNRSSLSPAVIDIRGGAGTGKSRLLKECIERAKLSGFEVLSMDAKQYDGFSIYREMLCACLGIICNKSGLEGTLLELDQIIKRYNGSTEMAEALYSFIVKQSTEDEVLYLVRSALVFFARHPVGDVNMLFVIDNTQCLSADALEVLYKTTHYLTQQETRTIIAIGTNTEIIPIDNRIAVEDFLQKLDQIDSASHYSFTCKELQPKDAKTLYHHALNEQEQIESLIDLLVEKSGKRAFDIIMIIQWLHDQRIIHQAENGAWDVDRFENFEEAIRCIPGKSKEVLMQRFRMQRGGKFSFPSDISFFEVFQCVMKSLLYFQGRVPISFFESLGIDELMLLEVNQSQFSKLDESKPELTFFHDNIQRFLQQQKIFSCDRKLSLQVVTWVQQNDWYQSDMRSYIMFTCYINAGLYDDAIRFGEMAVYDETKRRNFTVVVRIGEQLIDHCGQLLDSNRKFKLFHAIANAYRTSVDLHKSIEFYRNASQMILTYEALDVARDEKCRFFHEYANAQLVNCQFKEMLDVLVTFEKNTQRSEFYEFILQNRFSVAYLALGEISLAEQYIDQAIRIAQKAHKIGWESIAYSDKAYIYYRALEQKESAAQYFAKAVKTHDAQSASINRSSEILAQKAFTKLLIGETENAQASAHQALERALEIHGLSMEIKSRNLYAITLCFQENDEAALALWNENIMISSRHKSIEGVVKACTNIGATYLRQRKLTKASIYFQKAYQRYRENKLSLMTHKPLIYNYLRLLHITGKYGERDQLLEDNYFDNLSKFYNEITVAQNDEISTCYWPLYYQGYFYNY